MRNKKFASGEAWNERKCREPNSPCLFASFGDTLLGPGGSEITPPRGALDLVFERKKSDPPGVRSFMLREPTNQIHVPLGLKGNVYWGMVKT